jgi:hypothetical protein
MYFKIKGSICFKEPKHHSKIKEFFPRKLVLALDTKFITNITAQRREGDKKVKTGIILKILA